MRRALVLLLLVLGALALVLVVGSPPRQSGPESVRGPRVLRVAAAAVREITLQGATRQLVAVRTAAGWRLDDRPATPGQAEALDALVETLVGLRAVDAFRTSDRAVLGLDPPAATVAVRTDRRTRTLRLGSPNAAGSALYAEREGHPRVFLVGTGLLSAIDRVFYQRDVGVKAQASCERCSLSWPPANGGPHAPEDALEILQSLTFVERIGELHDDPPHVGDVDVVQVRAQQALDVRPVLVAPRDGLVDDEILRRCRHAA